MDAQVLSRRTGVPDRPPRPEAHKRLRRGSDLRGKRDFTSDLRGKSRGDSVSKDEGIV